MACVASLENAKNDMAQTPNPTVERTCAKSRAGRSLPRYASRTAASYAARKSALAARVSSALARTPKSSASLPLRACGLGSSSSGVLAVFACPQFRPLSSGASPPAFSTGSPLESCRPSSFSCFRAMRHNTAVNADLRYAQAGYVRR